MFLKFLTLNGFKAFAEKTTIRFEEGICGLIGPNGCGKSNIIDAIKWVVGEQKISELRGDRMEDIIFHGSEGEKTCHMAEVEMVLQNEASILPVEMTEVSVNRRFYRSGESEFLINRKPCRLKDIQNLFFETGIGKSSSSIIEQGRIEKVLSKNPEDRRYIFEEAASIYKYRERKSECKRKMEKTGENLKRLDDLIREIEVNRNRLKKQAEASRRYREFQENIKKAEIDLLIYRLLEIRKKQSKVGKSIDETKKKISWHAQTLEKSKIRIHDIQSRLDERKKNLGGFEKKRIEIEEKINAQHSQNAIFIEQHEEISRLLEEKKEEIQSLRQEENQAVERFDQLAKAIGKEQKERQEHRKKLEIHRNHLKDLEGQLIESHSRHKGLVKRKEEMDREEKELHNKHFLVVEELVQEIDILKERMEKDQKERTKRKEELLEALRDMESRLAELIPWKDKAAVEKHIHDHLEPDREKMEQAHAELIRELFAYKEMSDLRSRLLDGFLHEKDDLYELIFSREGTYAKKQKIDLMIEELHRESEIIKVNIDRLSQIIHSDEEKMNRLRQEAAEIEINSASLNQSIEMSLRIQEERGSDVEAARRRRQGAELQIQQQSQKLKEMESRGQKGEAAIGALETENRKLSRDMDNYSKHLETELGRLGSSEKQRLKAEQAIRDQEGRLNELETNLKLLEKDADILCELAMTNHSENLRQREKKKAVNREFHPERLKALIRNFQEQMKPLASQFNPLAQEDYDTLMERLEEMQKQRRDILHSMEDLERVIDEIDASSREEFLSTIKKIQANFHLLFRRLFNGGQGKIKLLDENDVLQSGIDILIQPPGKKLQNINLLSGGERSLIAIALMFAVFLVRPAPLCLLDEVDAALDTINIDRLARMIGEFKQKVQFILITHNDKTASILDYIYGITMKNGITKTVSMKLPAKK